MDINSLLSALTSNLGASDAAIKTEQPRAAATTAGMQTAATDMNAFIQDSITKSSLATAQAAEVERRKAAAGETAQIIANLNPDDLNNAYVQSMAQLTATQAEREATLAQYRKLTETSFLDNPVGYIFNQLALPQVVQKHNNLAVQQDNITADLATRTNLMYQNKTQVTANVADAAKEARLTEAAAAASMAQANAEKVRMENFGKVSASRMNELALTDKLVQNASTRYSAGMNMAQFQAMQAERAEARAERKMRMDAAAKDKAEKDAQDGALAIGLARVSGVLGYPMPVTLEDFKKMPASKAKQELYNAAVEGKYGDSLVDSVQFLTGGNLQRMQQDDPAFVGGIKNVSAGIKSYATQIARKIENAKMRPEEATRQGAAEYTMAVTLAAHDPKALNDLNSAAWDATFNPYRSQDATMLAGVKSGQFKALANNSYVKVLDTVAATVPPGTQELRGEDRNNAIKALAALVSERKIPLNQAAADLVAYTRTAAAYNQQTLKLASLGFDVQESAFVRVPGVAIIGKAAVGDTMNQASAENLLATIAANTLKGRLTSPANPAMAIFGGVGTVGVLATQQANRLFDITPEK